MDSNQPSNRRRWSWKLGALFASLAKKLKYPVLASVPVSAAMLSRVDAVSSDQTLGDAAQMLVSRNADQLPVVDHGWMIGVITRTDLTTALQESGPRAPVAAASHHQVLMVDPSDSLTDVLDRLRAQPDSVALVVDHGSPMGLLTADQLSAYLAKA